VQDKGTKKDFHSNRPALDLLKPKFSLIETQIVKVVAHPKMETDTRIDFSQTKRNAV
jgi:hypothetical protein